MSSELQNIQRNSIVAWLFLGLILTAFSAIRLIRNPFNTHRNTKEFRYWQLEEKNENFDSSQVDVDKIIKKKKIEHSESQTILDRCVEKTYEFEVTFLPFLFPLAINIATGTTYTFLIVVFFISLFLYLTFNLWKLHRIYVKRPYLRVLLESLSYVCSLVLLLNVLATQTSSIPYFITMEKPPQDCANKTFPTSVLWPLPKSLSLNHQAETLVISPCDIDFEIIAPTQEHIKEIINLYQTQVWKCNQESQSDINLVVSVKNTSQMTALQTKHEKYSLIVRQSSRWSLDAEYYVGFLRAFETFSQLFEQRLSDINEKETVIRGIPIVVEDQPDYVWRGLMVDSSRHFLPIGAMKKIIDGLLYSKMSVLHWHITDNDSFPMQIENIPDLAKYGAVSGTYSEQEIQDLIKYARTRGVRMIPEIDSPGHTESWGRSPAFKDAVLVYSEQQYSGLFDPTLDLTYALIQGVMEHINSAFIDNYVHFGGDEINLHYLDEQPEVVQRMNTLNISSSKDLQIYYRKQQKMIWRKINATKKSIYWANEEIDLPFESDDVIHWWGITQNVARLKGCENQVILSNYDSTYLDIGFGNKYGGSYNIYQNWRNLYKYNPKIEGVNVIGGEVCSWSELTNSYNMGTKVWLRNSVMAQRLWNVNIDLQTSLINIAKRLHSQAERMRVRDFKVSPVTVGLCEQHMELCFE